VIDLGKESRKNLELVARTPGSALGSVRRKPSSDECARALDTLARLDVSAFFYIGGNDSAETAQLLQRMAEESGRELSVFHVPKTIDNDLRATDHCPGYGSAAKFVAQAFQGDEQDNRSLHGIKINVVMGRHAGWLTAASALARARDGDGPHLIYVPERVFRMDAFLADVERVHRELGRCVIAVSEGIHGADGKPIYESKERDSHGNVQLSGSGALGDLLAARIKQGLGDKLRVRADTFGYLQRSYAGTVSEVDAKEARAVGRFAARTAAKGKFTSGSVSLRRAERKGYKISLEVVELSEVARETRAMPEELLAGDNDVSEAFLAYALPLVGRLPKMGRLASKLVALAAPPT
jgi:6-phosphofructokinase 1